MYKHSIESVRSPDSWSTFRESLLPSRKSLPESGAGGRFSRNHFLGRAAAFRVVVTGPQAIMGGTEHSQASIRLAPKLLRIHG